MRLSLVPELGDPQQVFCAMTDADGIIDAAFELPEPSDREGDLALLCEARVGGAIAELRQPVSNVAESV